jgi:uncharacterized protein (DUF305 family)
MTELTSRSSAVFLLVALSAVACSGPRNEGVRTAPEPTAGETGPLDPGTSARSTGGRYPYTEADVQFMSHMIQHHSQALVMASWASSHGASPEVRRLAERIMNGQQDEIASMQRWLQDRGEPAPDSGTGTKMHSEHPSPSSGHDHMLMPGMLTDTQMNELDQARGREFDRLFLTYMIQHHQGAVTMVQDLFATPGAAREETTFKLASDISADQSSEIKRMQRMLSSLDGRSS